MKGVFNMMFTGIVRRIDVFGRVVIPKEIKRKMGIKERERFKIYIDLETNSIIFKKYEETDLVDTFFSNLLEEHKDDEQAKHLIKMIYNLAKKNEG